MTSRDFRRGLLVGAIIFAAGALPTALIALCLSIAQVWPFDGQPTTPPEAAFGWLGPEAAREAERQVFGDNPPVFSLTSPLPMNTPRRVVLWEPAKTVLGRHIPTRRQEIGDCVSHGWANAIAYRLAVVASFQQAEYHDVCAPYIYGAARVFVGKGRIRGDGAVGAWAAEAVLTYGVLPADHQLAPPYSGAIARKWGAPPGPPPDTVEVAKRFLVRTAAKVLTIEDAKTALRAGYPIAVCSTRGFQMEGKLRDGKRWGVPSGTWAHCMCWIGIDADDSIYNLNSWGEDAHGAPATDEPPGGFWITPDVAAEMLRADDSYSVSELDGFEPVDWRILQRKAP